MGAAAATSTVSDVWPTSSLASTRTRSCTLTGMSDRTERLNPVASTATAYLPTSSGVATYSPDASVLVFTAILVPMLVMVIAAPAMTAPLGSVTVPTIEPAVVCAPSGDNEAIKHKAKQIDPKEDTHTPATDVRIPSLQFLPLYTSPSLPTKIFDGFIRPVRAALFARRCWPDSG